MRDHDELVERAALAVSARLPFEPPEILLTLGSGLAPVADRIEDPYDVPAAAVPGIHVPHVAGHPGVLRFGTLAGRRVLAQVGRVHLYEVGNAADVVRTVDVAAALGCETFVVTNAAGGLQEHYIAGDLLVIADQLNLTGHSPPSRRDGAQAFVDMAGAYDPALIEAAVAVAESAAIPVHTGVYAGLTGPAYETPAEVRMLRALGADAVGMSTVLEVIAARAAGLRVLGLSTITNVHGPGVPTTHAEVVAVGAAAADHVATILLGVLQTP